MHEGAVSAELGLARLSVDRGVGDDRPRPAIARHEGAPLHLCHVSAAESVAEIRRARELGVEVTAEVTPHHLCLTDGAVAASTRPRQDEPAASLRRRPGGADRRARGRHARLHRHRPRAAPRPREGQPFEEAPNGVIGLETAFAAIYTHLVEPGLVSLATVVERMSAGPAAAFGLRRRRSRVGGRPTWRLGSGRELAGAAAVRLPLDATAPSPARPCAAAAG